MTAHSTAMVRDEAPPADVRESKRGRRDDLACKAASAAPFSSNSREETLKLEQDLARPFIPAERLIFRIIIRPAVKRG